MGRFKQAATALTAALAVVAFSASAEAGHRPWVRRHGFGGHGFGGYRGFGGGHFAGNFGGHGWYGGHRGYGWGWRGFYPAVGFYADPYYADPYYDDYAYYDDDPYDDDVDYYYYRRSYRRY